MKPVDLFITRILRPALARAGYALPDRNRTSKNASPHVLMYCASNIGLGHLMRISRVATQLRRLTPGANLMLITDNPLRPEPFGLGGGAVVQLPRFGFDGEGEYGESPRGLDLDNDALRALRANVILAAVQSFRPDVFLMDTNPHGKRNELQPALKFLKQAGWPTARVLELRDIPFPPEEASRLHARTERLARDMDFYDAVLVAGDPAFFDLAEAYQWPETVRRKVSYVGFMQPEATDAPEPEAQIAAMLERPARRIVASFGGGWEAAPLAEAVLGAHASLADGEGETQLFLFAGPAIEPQAFDALRARFADRPDVFLSRFSASFPALLPQADLAILQAGSTPFQILDSDVPMIVYARDFTIGEQQLRAERLARFGGVRVIDAEWMKTGDLGALARELIDAPRAMRKTGMRFDGASRAAAALARLLQEPARASAPQSLVE